MTRPTSWQKLMRLTATVAVLAGCASDPEAAGRSTPVVADSVRLPDSPTGQRFPAFLEAFNTGRFDELRRYFESVGVETARAANTAAYWKGVHNEYGPVTLETVDTTRAVPWFWVRGRTTRAWAAFFVDFSEGPEPTYTGGGVDRGNRPPGYVPRAVSADRLPAELERYLTAVERGGQFSGVVAIAKDGERIFQGAYGEADASRGIANTIETRFPIASMAKMLTAVAVLQLIDRGRLGLSDPLTRFVPEYPARIGSAVTVRHLLTHSSGIELDDHVPFNRQVQRARSVEEMLQAQLDHLENMNQGPPDRFELAEGFDYTNEGFDLLGLIVARATGQSWRDYLREHILEPVGMSGTGFSHDESDGRLAVGYTRGSNQPDGRRRDNRDLLSPLARPSGNMYSTAGDMLRFLEAIRTRALLGDEIAREATSPQIPWGGIVDVHYGYGFQIIDADGVRYFGHGGSQPGVSTRGYIYPESAVTVVVLSNYEDAAVHVAAYVHELVVGSTGSSEEE